jgi:hypothetical protein
MKDINEQINEVLRLAGVNEKYILEEGLKEKVAVAATTIACACAVIVGLSNSLDDAKMKCKVNSVKEELASSEHPSQYTDIEYPEHTRENTKDITSVIQYTLECVCGDHKFNVQVTDTAIGDEYSRKTGTYSIKNDNVEVTNGSAGLSREIRVVTDTSKNVKIDPSRNPQIFDKNLDMISQYMISSTINRVKTPSSSYNNEQVDKKHKGENHLDPTHAGQMPKAINNAISDYNRKISNTPYKPYNMNQNNKHKEGLYTSKEMDDYDF